MPSDLLGATERFAPIVLTAAVVVVALAGFTWLGVFDGIGQGGVQCGDSPCEFTEEQKTEMINRTSHLVAGVVVVLAFVLGAHFALTERYGR